jgi:hypothetical protein
LFCEPAAAHASTSAVACASELVPPGGIAPPNHERTEPVLLASEPMQFGDPQSFCSPDIHEYIALALPAWL